MYEERNKIAEDLAKVDKELLDKFNLVMEEFAVHDKRATSTEENMKLLYN